MCAAGPGFYSGAAGLAVGAEATGVVCWEAMMGTESLRVVRLAVQGRPREGSAGKKGLRISLARFAKRGLKPVVLRFGRYATALATGLMMVISSSSIQATVLCDGYTGFNPDGTVFEGRGVAWSGSLLVAVGSAGVIKTSPDGYSLDWTEQTSPTTNQLNAIVWSGTQFIAVGEAGAVVTSDKSATSWNLATIGDGSVAFYGITWGGGQFVAVGTGGAIYTSADGSNWTSQTSGTAQNLYGVTRSTDKYVAVGTAGTIRTSADGVTWTGVTSNATTQLEGIAWSGSSFVVVGQNYIANNCPGTPTTTLACNTILTSPDGTTWTRRRVTNPVRNLHAVTWSGGKFNVAADGGVILSSATGALPWTSSLLSVGGERLQGVTWTGFNFVTVGATNRFGYNDCPWGDGMSLAADRWTQIGLPAAPENSSVYGVFQTNQAQPYSGLADASNYTVPADGSESTWIVQKRDASTGAYVPLADTSVPMNQTDGYWIKSWGAGYDVALDYAMESGTIPATATPLVTTNANCPSTVGCYEIALTAPASGADRANLVSFPLPYPVLWSDVRFEVNGVADTPSEAQTADFARKTYYIWNGTSYASFDDSTAGLIGQLQPWQGIWVMVKPGASGKNPKLLIPAIPKVSQVAPASQSWMAQVLDWLIAPAAAASQIPAEPRVPAEPAPAKATAQAAQGWAFGATAAQGLEARSASLGADASAIDEGSNWYVRIVAFEPVENMLDRSNVFGQLDGTSIGYDDHDLSAMAPIGSPYLDLVFSHTDWGAQSGIYNSDYRPVAAGNGADQWRFQLRSDIPRQVRLTWEGPKEVLDRSVLVNDRTGQQFSLKTPNIQLYGVLITMKKPTESFTWRYLGR
jgi:hypothetical protein